MDFSPLILSLRLSMVSTVILLVLAAPLTYVLAYGRFRGKILVEALVGLPLVLPPTVLGFYLLLVLGPDGMIGGIWQAISGQPLLFTFIGIVIASMFHSLPYAVQPLRAAFEKIDPRLLETAAVLGCSPMAAFFRVVLPNARGGLVAAAVLAFAHTMGEFGVILMVGGSIPGKTRVASIAIYEYVEALRYHEAWQLSLALVVISYVVLLLVSYLNRGGRYGA
ncbi:MAG TPA: molybdate ABC transporter permease subunit [Deltaproteobacteria bacterium]|nr:molybdate ABC transporter permease subunit [Deltaproteobacteria bacterium]